MAGPPPPRSHAGVRPRAVREPRSARRNVAGPPPGRGWSDRLGAPGEIRTHTGCCLRASPLPLGYRGRTARKPYPTSLAPVTQPVRPATPADDVRRVVIAEDEALIRMDLAEMLGEEGYEVVGQAGDGQKAIELARELRPDLVILDVKMPVLDGIAAAEAIARGADRPGRHPHRLLPARPRRPGPRRRRDGLPGQAVPARRPGAGDRDGGQPLRRDHACSSRRSPTSRSRWRRASRSTAPRACCRRSWRSASPTPSAGSRRPRWTSGCR